VYYKSWTHRRRARTPRSRRLLSHCLFADVCHMYIGMYVCMYVCIYICIKVFICQYVHAYLDIYVVFTYINMTMYIHIYMYMYIFMYTFMYIYTHLYMYACIYIHVHSYVKSNPVGRTDRKDDLCGGQTFQYWKYLLGRPAQKRRICKWKETCMNMQRNLHECEKRYIWIWRETYMHMERDLYVYEKGHCRTDRSKRWSLRRSNVSIVELSVRGDLYVCAKKPKWIWWETYMNMKTE